MPALLPTVVYRKPSSNSSLVSYSKQAGMRPAFSIIKPSGERMERTSMDSDRDSGGLASIHAVAVNEYREAGKSRPFTLLSILVWHVY